MKTEIDISDAILASAAKVTAQGEVTLKDLAEEGLVLALEKHARSSGRQFSPVTVPGKEPASKLSWAEMGEALYGDEPQRIMGDK
jgi:hypothetical protein